MAEMCVPEVSNILHWDTSTREGGVMVVECMAHTR